MWREKVFKNKHKLKREEKLGVCHGEKEIQKGGKKVSTQEGSVQTPSNRVSFGIRSRRAQTEPRAVSGKPHQHRTMLGSDTSESSKRRSRCAAKSPSVEPHHVGRAPSAAVQESQVSHGKGPRWSHQHFGRVTEQVHTNATTQNTTVCCVRRSQHDEQPREERRTVHRLEVTMEYG